VKYEFVRSLLFMSAILATSAAPAIKVAVATTIAPITCLEAEHRGARGTPSPDVNQQIADMRRLEARPHDSGAVEYTLAELYAQAGQYCTSLSYLKQTVALHQGWDPSNDPLFQNMNRIDAYQGIVEKLKVEFPAIHASAIVFSIHEPTMVPENVTYDPATATWYVSSIYLRKVIRVNAAGHTSTFLRPRQYGLWEAIGMKIDRTTNSLWICTAAESEGSSTNGSSALLNVDLKTGRLLHKYVINGGTTQHLFNDLVLDHHGNIYISDSRANTLYWLPAATHKLEILVPGFSVNFPNGIDLDPTQNLLYVAYSYGGIDVIDLRTKKFHQLAHPQNVTIEGIDGMYYYDHSLIGVQSIGTERVARFYLDRNGSRVVREQTLEFRNPIFQQPTEGGIVGSNLYYVANAQNFWLTAGKLNPSHTFVDPVVLKINLGN
jgi:hypothetical protein